MKNIINYFLDIILLMNVIADERFIDPETGALDLKAADLITYCHGHYYALGEELGHFGWSVRKKPKTTK